MRPSPFGVVADVLRTASAVAEQSGALAVGVAVGAGQAAALPVTTLARTAGAPAAALARTALAPTRAAARAAISATGAAARAAGPVTEPARAVGAALADATGWSRRGQPTVAWAAGRRLHLDLDVDGVTTLPAEAEAMVEAVAALPGVEGAHVEWALRRLVVERHENVDVSTVAGCAHDALAAARRGHLREVPPPAVIAADPGDRMAVATPALAAAADVVAVVGALAGRLARVPPAPRAARAAVAVIQYQPRVTHLLQSRLGRVGTDLLVTGLHATAHGLGQAPGASLLDLAQRSGQLLEAGANRDAWRRLEPSLATADRPQLPLATVGGTWVPSTQIVVGGAVDAAIDAAKGATPGPVETYVDQAASGSLVAAAGTMLASGNSGDVADAILAGVPKAAQLGREGFASVLGRGLARRDLLVLDPGALRRLDRIAVVVVDGAALRGDSQAVLEVTACRGAWEDDRVFEVADALLHGETPPAPDAGQPAADDARLVRQPESDRRAPASGLERHHLVVGGEVAGEVAVGWELDPYAGPLLQTARRTGARVVLRHVAGTEELAASVDEQHRRGTPLLDTVRTLREDRGPVLLVAALHPDAASDDTLAALAVADVSVALDDPRAAVAWTSDILTGGDLAAAVRLLSALPAARRASTNSVRLAKAGTTLAGLLLVSGQPNGQPRIGLRRWFSPVDAMAAAAITAGAGTALQVLRLPDPDPQPMAAWHALDAQVVFSRLTGGARPLAAPAVPPWWRRRLYELADMPAVAPLEGPVRATGRLVAATRQELSDPLTPVLAVGAAASATLGSSVDAVLVAGVMAVNAVVGGVQRLRAESAAAELFADQEQLARRVVVPPVGGGRRRWETARGGQRTVLVTARRLRPGDVIDLKAPDVVPADARLLAVDDLEVDESSLTGESLPVLKTAEATIGGDPAERASMVFEGSTVVAGAGRAVVVATGSATAARRAVAAVSGQGPAVGVQERLRELTSTALPMTLAGGAAVTGLSLLRRRPLRNAVADGVAIAVAAVPEGLPLVATMAQLAAARRLSEEGVLVRAPRTLEALGRVGTVCFDKTGTLTESRLRVVTVADAGHQVWDVDDPDAATVLRLAARACPHPESGHRHAHVTDEAVLAAAVGLDDHAWKPVIEVPFESSRGYAASIGAQSGRRGQVLVVKGAPEVILERCRAADRRRAAAMADELAAEGLRVLAVARKNLGAAQLAPSEDDGDEVDRAASAMTLAGFVGLADTLRPSARPLVEQLVEAGVRVALITGDHPITAQAIARQVGLSDGAPVMTGSELAQLDDDARAEAASSAQVFARVSPEQKVQVVSALQHSGQVVAMVGDGANDAAAIRMADVGVGVSGRGSSAARVAADLVLTEDDLTALLDALVEGRSMWASVRDAVTILLGGNAGEVAFTILGTALGGRAPVSTRQVLLVNLLTDMFPALAVAVTPQSYGPDNDLDDPALREARRRQFRRQVLQAEAPSLDRPLVQAIATRGAATAAGASMAWAIGRWTPGTVRRSSTMGLTALVGTQLAQTLLTRRHSPLVILTAVGSAAALVGIVQTPGVSQFFGCTPLGPVAWTAVLGSTAAATAISVAAPAWLASRSSPAPGGEGISRRPPA